MSKLWTVVLEQWKETSMGDSGCSIPFLVGIEKRHGTDFVSNQTSVDELFSYLLNNTSKTEKYRIGFCPKIHCPVVERNTNGSLDYTNGEWVTPNLYVDEELFRRYSDDFSKVQSLLKTESLDKLEVGCYSLNEGQWGDFSPKEVKFIGQVIQSLR